MNLRDLKYLVALSDYQHFGKASQACFVSQPALSMQIKKLEDYLGILLIERKNKSFLFTPVGQEVVKYARNILQQTEEMRKTAEFSKDPYAGQITIGIIPTLAPYLLPHTMPPLTEKFKKLSIYLEENKTAVLLKKLTEGQLDIAILATPTDEPHLETLDIFNEECLLAVPSDHRFAKKKAIMPHHLADEKILLLEEGHCLRDQNITFCNSISVNDYGHFKGTSLETLRYIVAAKMGVAFMPKLACQKHESLAYVPFASPKPKRTINMTWRALTPRKKLFTELAHYIQKISAGII